MELVSKELGIDAPEHVQRSQIKEKLGKVQDLKYVKEYTAVLVIL